MDNSQMIKYCRICGDRASGFNYNELCCESCKVFFCRNFHNEMKLKCLQNESCTINISTRKSCAKCRLMKCFLYGMRVKLNAKKNDYFKNLEVEKTNYLDLNLRYILENINSQNINLNPVNFNLPPCPYIVTRKRKYASELIALERQMIANVHNVVVESFVEETGLKVVGTLQRVIDLFNHSAMYSRRIVQFCKSISAFKELNGHDQMIILKSFYYEILFVRFSYIFDTHKCGHPLIENESGTQAMFVNMEITNNYKNKELAHEGLQFNVDLHLELENDFTIRDLMIALLLFKPRDDYTNPEYILYQHTLYCRLLRRYLEHKYKNVKQANRKYLSLMRLMESFANHLERAQSLTLAEVDISQLPEIVVEVLNLNV